MVELSNYSMPTKVMAMGKAASAKAPKMTQKKEEKSIDDLFASTQKMNLSNLDGINANS